ncbi:rod shape-determining protein MreD [Candidatus Blochmanniella vafra str. BVAF]|uniref:Rod shape-determining protein MreD n=1 Tax=Blochmanniella vafra (strain BVAF) TaxID=859654 RepID=E8Q6V0_BLOVB|nr:rod shape-determining protein MreD [Candidatus Blochmannia vafer]ADV33697.1 rod shape-determining protein MreD [Candidatus Blochmannia vafer str. BVAF]
MRHYRIVKYKIGIVCCSFIIAMVLQGVMSLVTTWYFQPSWILMVLIYWINMHPNKINIGAGFVLGLLTDCICFSTIGVHALSFSILSYVVVRKVYIFRYTSIWQQSFFVLFFSLINQSIKFLIKFFIIKNSCSPEIFWNCILDFSIWPFLVFLMSKHFTYK